MKSEYVLLGLLARRPFSGYEIAKWLETEGKFLKDPAHHSQIYRALGRMVSDGWIEFEVDPREGRPDAKVYRLTDVGRMALLEWARSEYRPPVRFQKPDFIARLTLGGPVAPDTVLDLIRTELAFRREQVRLNRDRERPLHHEDAVPELDKELDLMLHGVVHEWGTTAVDRWIAWLEDLEHRISEREERDR